MLRNFLRSIFSFGKKRAENQRALLDSALRGKDAALRQKVLGDPRAAAIFSELYGAETRRGYPPNFARRAAFEKLLEHIRKKAK